MTDQGEGRASAPVRAADSVTVRSNAKINPVLRVVGRREDGFHELETLMLGLGLGGFVTVEVAHGAPLGSIVVETRGARATPDIVDGPAHLALRGAALAREVLGLDTPLCVRVDKQVPSRAGLGGGSADAAAAARAVLHLCGKPGDEERLAVPVLDGLAAIGSDCSFFFGARDHSAALVRGRGELIEVVDGRPDWWIGIVTPAVDCATPDVYRALSLEQGRIAPGALTSAHCADLFARGAPAARDHLDNDLEEAALRAFPVLCDWLDLIDEVGASHMTLTGSGSSLFGLFDEQAEAAAVVETVLYEGRERGLAFRFACVTRAEASLLGIVGQAQ